MSKYKNRNCYPRFNKNGELISYRFHYSGKDPITGEHKQYTTTWKVPRGLGQKDIEKERKKFEIEFIKQCEDKSQGVFVADTYMTFGEFADQWLEEIKLRENAFGSYSGAKNHIKILKEWFGNYQLKQISPSMIQKFYNYLCSRTYTKNSVYVKKSITELLNEQNLPQHKVAENCGLNRLTLRMASKVGSQVSMATARAVCKYFNVPLDTYFSVEKTQHKYSCATNRGIRTTLVMIFNSARKRMLIEHNYATREYTNPISGPTKEKIIFDEEEAREFLKCVAQESDLRKKTVFALYIFLGLRNAEVCGLEWEDIDLINSRLNITRNSLYVRDFGIVTKEPKTTNSKRELAIPYQLTEILREYKIWWDEQKVLHGDLWYNSNRLFLQDDGKPLHPCTPAKWLNKFEIQHGLSHVTPHALRHTSITLQLLAGVPIKSVSQRAGHADEHITLKIYTHFLKEEDKRAAEVFDKFLTVS